MSKAKHPMQPVEIVDNVARFKANVIVRFLLEWSSPRGVDMNAIAVMNFSREDREQFAQLIGYSVSGASELGYVSDKTIAIARKESERLLALKKKKAVK